MRQIRNRAAALAVIAALASCSNDAEGSSGSTATDDEPTTTSSTPTPDYTIVPAESGFIEPGRWAIRADQSPETPLAVIDVPTAGFNGGERWIWTNEAVIGFWTVTGVHKDPCTRSGPAASAGATVEDLAAALDAQRRTTATEPVPVAIDGYEGLSLEVSTPAKLDYGTCDEDGLVIWDDAPAWSEREVTRFWILDVDGQRVVLTLNGWARATKATERVFTGMVNGATFVGAD